MAFELRNGDCYKLIEEIEDKSIDLVVTDPPYKLGNTQGGGLFKACEDELNNPYNRKKTISFSELELLDCADFDAIRFLELIKSKMKKFYGYFFCNKFVISEYLEYAKKNKLSYEIFVLYKENPIPARNNHYLPDMEYCILLREAGTYFSKDENFNCYKKMFSVSNNGTKIHPAEKPVRFLENFIRISCPKGGTVLDPFMGSGSTGVAALLSKRNFIGIEKNEKYFEIAKERINKTVNDIKGTGSLFEGLLEQCYE